MAVLVNAGPPGMVAAIRGIKVPGNVAPNSPVTGQLWPRQRGYAVRATATIVTASLAPAAAEVGYVQMANGYRLLNVWTSCASRTRLYTTAALRDADLARLISTPPGNGAGCMVDYLTTSQFPGGDLSPVIDGHNGGPSDSRIPYSVVNQDSVARAVTVILTYLRTE